MKKIIIYLMLACNNLFGGPFAYKTYVHYDLKINLTGNQKASTYSSNIYDRDLYSQRYDKPSEINAFIKRACGNHKILKPFVFVEGVSFDKEVWTEAQYKIDSYFHRIVTNSDGEIVKNGNGVEMKWQNFSEMGDTYNSIVNQGIDPTEKIGYSTFNWGTLVSGVEVEGLMADDPLEVKKCPDLLNKLYDNGYDIIFVDFQSGQNFMENNGFALSKLLKTIKDTLDNNGSPEKLVVCGASMGGLVSRFAIRDLELNGADKYKTCVGKFISFDAPQMGANINLGMQYLLQNFKALPVDLIRDKYAKLTCPSASQLVLYSCLSDPINWYWPVKNTTASQSMERMLFNLHPNVATWPTNCKKISIINGSRNGNKQNTGSVDACERLFDGDGLVSVDIKSLPNYGDGYCKIYDFEIPTIGCQPSYEILAQAIANNSVRVKNSRGVDIVAGSYRTDLTALSDANHWISSVVAGVVAPCNLISYFTPSTGSAPNYCFIPALSAAGVKNFDGLVESSHIALPQIFQGFAKFEDPNHNVSNFDVVYAPTTNQTHVEITDENIKWVMYELLDIENEHLKFQNEYIDARTHKAEKTIRAGSNVGKYSDASFETNQIEGIIFQPANLPAPTFLSVGTSVSIFVAEGQDEGVMYDVFSQQNVLFKSYAVSFNGLNSEFILGEAEIQSLSPYCYISKTFGSSQFDGVGNEFVNNIFHFNFATPFCDYCGPAIVRGNGNITKFFAGETISLEPGFFTEDNAVFEASIFGGYECENINAGRYATEPIASSNSELPISAVFSKQKKIENLILKEEIENKNVISLFPNPASNSITISSSEELKNILVFNLFGEQIYTNNNLGKNNVEIATDQLSNGVYVFSIETENSTKRERVIIQK
jgi:hypothetical protein